MPVYDGQSVSAGITNPAFLDAQLDDVAVGKIGFHNTDSASGSNIDNIQRCTNRLFTATGVDENTNNGTTYGAPSSTITNGQSHQAALTSLANKFHQTSGHTHDGTAGNGAPISAPNLANVPLRGYVIQGTDMINISGTSKDVTTLLSSKTASIGSTYVGVVVTPPNNKIVLRQATGANQDTPYYDGSGRLVHGYLTYSLGTWTLSFMVDIAGVDTPYSFTNNDVRWYFQELYNPMINPPVYSEFATIPSENATADVVDASTTQRGLVSTGTQSFGGDKTFANGVNIQGVFNPQSTVEMNTVLPRINFGGNDASAENAGIQVDRTSAAAQILFDSSLTSKWKIGVIGTLYEIVVSGVNQAINGIKTFTNTTDATSSTSGGTIFSGGIAVAKKLFVGTTINSGSFGGAAKALISDTSKNITESATTATEIGYVSGVTSAIQSQINSKADDASVVHLTGTETITGNKTFNGTTLLNSFLLKAETTDNVTTGSNATVAPTTICHRLTNASLISISMISSPSNGQEIVLINDTGNTITINNESGGTTTNRIYTGASANISLPNTAAILLIYSAGITRWRVVGGSSGSSGAATTLTFTVVAGENLTTGDAVYISKGNANGDTGRTIGQAYKLDATNDNRIEYSGLVTATVSSGGNAVIQVSGEITFGSGLTQGSPIFASVTTPGSYQTTAPTTIGQWVIELGIPSQTTKVLINGALSASNIKITNNSGWFYNTTIQSGTTYSIPVAMDVVLANASANNMTVTLPTAIGYGGKLFRIKKVDSSANTVLINTTSAQTIDGSTNKTIYSQYDSFSLLSDGSNWNII